MGLNGWRLSLLIILFTQFFLIPCCYLRPFITLLSMLFHGPVQDILVLIVLASSKDRAFNARSFALPFLIFWYLSN